jgi:hypothetical protein
MTARVAMRGEMHDDTNAGRRAGVGGISAIDGMKA